jgi:molybdopterin/thiamine biosynthesis adenylyltransferase
MRTLRLPAGVVRQLREELLRPDDQERFAFLYAGSEGDLLGARVVPVTDEEMTRQSRTACRPAPAVERDHVGTCYDEGLAPVLVHSHPFSADPRFSGIDVESMGRFREWLTGLFPGRSFGFAVVGTHGVEAVGDAEGRLESLSIEVIGDWKLETPVPGARSRFAVADRHPHPTRQESATDGGTAGVDDEPVTADGTTGKRFDRTVRAFGAEGQRRLRDATVGIVGVGGLGSLVAEQLVRLGVEDLVIVDPDTVEESNLSRLFGAFDHHVGKPKVTAVREHLWQCGTDDLEIEAVCAPVQERTAVLDRCDAVVGAVDSVTARSFCNEYAVKRLTYYVDAGVRIDTTDDQGVEMTGYVHLVAPGSNACFDCLGRHDQAAARIEQLSPKARDAERDRGYIDDAQLEPEPAVVHLNGACASKAVSVLVDLVTGRSAPPDFVRYEDTAHEMTALTTEPSSACPTCGEDGVLGVGRRSFGEARFRPDEAPVESN